MSLRILIPLLACSCLSSTVFAKITSQVPLFLRPFATKDPIVALSLTDILERNPQPLIVENQSSDEWFWIDYAGTYPGFVRAARINKNMTVQAGALVYQSTEENTAVITTVTQPNTITVVDLEGDWVSVEYRGEAPLYFHFRGLELPDTSNFAQSTSKLPEPSAPAAAEPAFDGAGPGVPGMEVSPTASYSDYVEEPIVIQTIEIPAVGDVQPVHVQAPISSTVATAAHTPVPEIQTALPAGESQRYLQGYLRYNRGLNLLFSDAKKYKFVLEGFDGEELAFIDADALIHATPLEKYLDQKITIYGEVLESNDSPPLIINARHLQIP